MQDNQCKLEYYELLKERWLSSHDIILNEQCKTHCVLCKLHIYNSYPMAPNFHASLESFQRICHLTLSKLNASQLKGMDN